MMIRHHSLDRLRLLFPGLGQGEGLGGSVTKVSLFRVRLVRARAIDKLSARFDFALTDRGYLAMGGQIIDDGAGTQAAQDLGREGGDQGGARSSGK